MALQKFKSNDADLNKVQDNVEAALLDVAKSPLKNASLVSDVSITTSNREVRHGLAGPPRGWIAVKATAAVPVFSDTAHADPNNFIYLKGSASVTVTLLFF